MRLTRRITDLTTAAAAGSDADVTFAQVMIPHLAARPDRSPS